MRHIVDAIAAHGRNGDDTLMHVSRDELRMIRNVGDRIGIKTTINPKTGLHEAFNWLGTLGGIAGGALGTVILPGAGTAIGAGLGSAAGTAAGGGTLEQSLTTGLISGVTAYAGGAALGELSAAGAPPVDAVASTTGDVVGNVATNATADTITNTAGSNLATGGVDTLATGGVQAPVDAGGAALNPIAATPPPTQAIPTPQTAAPVTEGIDLPKGQNVTSFLQNEARAGNPDITTNLDALQPASTPKPDFSFSNVVQGIKNTPTGDLIKNYGLPALTTAGGQYAVGMSPVGTNTSSGLGITETDTSNPYAGELYTVAGTGEQRARAVRRPGYARGGDVWGDYEGVEEASDGGFVPGGGLNYFRGGAVQKYDIGGIAAVRNLQPGGAWGDMTAQAYGAQQKLKPEFLQNAEPGGFMGATVPGKMGWEDKQRKKEDEEEARRQQEEEQARKAAWQAQLDQLRSGTRPTTMTQQTTMSPGTQGTTGTPLAYADGGIASFGRGRYLQGPGDGMSDSIPASIDDRQPARLASGEFVVPADVVSHLGNGDSSAGAKQLHSMMDRARMARTGTKKQGKQINPRKVMPA